MLARSVILLAMADYAISWHIQAKFRNIVRKRSLAALARRALACEGASPGELVIAIADDATVRDLNRRFRSEDAATDVLSFGREERERFITPPRARRQLGEVVISYPTAARQAKAAGHPVDDELAHLLVHGVLHVLGYDHERADEARAMRSREDELLGRPAH